MTQHDYAGSRDRATIIGISAITLNVRKMARSIQFYEQLGFQVHHGGGGDKFTTLRNGACHVNLSVASDGELMSLGGWGRVILQVTGVDLWYAAAIEAGLDVVTSPQDGPWGERYFHLRDPDGHELSFAEVLSRQS